MIRVVGFEPEHLLNHLDRVRFLDHTVEYAEAFLEFYKETGPGFSLFIGDDLVCSLGANILWPGSALAWMYTTDLVVPHAKEFYEITARLIDSVMRTWKLRRLEAHVPLLQPKLLRFCENLGYEPEGLAKSYGPNGETYVRYAIIREV